MAHITEKRLYAVSPQPLISNGTTLGRVQVTDACDLFVVGQLVILESSTQPAITLKVKRIPDDTTLLLGPDNEPVQNYSNVSANNFSFFLLFSPNSNDSYDICMAIAL